MPFNNRLGRFAARAASAAALMAALASCGGGTYQVTSFVPARILSFGDESSMLVGPQGLKYSINGVSQDTQLVDCTLLPIWTQVLANSYGLVYGNCNPDAVASPGGVQLATVDATVDDLQNQVDTFTATDTFNNNDMVSSPPSTPPSTTCRIRSTPSPRPTRSTTTTWSPCGSACTTCSTSTPPTAAATTSMP